MIIDLDVADADTDGLADALTGAGPWDDTDFVATAPTDGLAHQLSLTSAQDLSAITLTLTGTDADGQAITEDVTGPNAGTVETTKYFKTLATVSADSTLSTNELDIGWVDEVASRTFPLNDRRGGTALFALQVTGTLVGSVQLSPDSYSGVLAKGQDAALWFEPDADLTDETADSTQLHPVEEGYGAFRVVLDSYSSGAELQVFAKQIDARG